MNKQLEQKINEIVTKKINEYLLNEYALERSDFMDRIYNLSRQIVIHWCLIRYSRLTNSNQEYIEHWKKELRTWLCHISNIRIKKNNSFEYRRKTIYKCWGDLDYITLPNTIKKVIYCKFTDEHINVNSNEVEQIIMDFMEETHKLIDLMADDDIELIYNYIKEL